MKSYATDLIAVACIVLGLLPWVLGDGVPFVPSDPPPVTVDALSGFIFEETGERKFEVATVLNSKDVEQARSHYKAWNMFDDDKVPDQWKPLLEAAKQREDFTLPWLVILDGNRWKQGPLPLVKSGDKVDIEASVKSVAAALKEFN